MGIRLLTKIDISRQAIIHSTSFRKAYENIIPESFLKDFTPEKREVFFRNEFEKYKDTYIIETDNEIIGFSTIGKTRDKNEINTGEIWGIYLHPDYWEKGYGTKLLNYLIEILKKRGFNEITLWVLEENLPARKFYEKNGFQFDGTRKKLSIGKDLIEIRYRLEI